MKKLLKAALFVFVYLAVFVGTQLVIGIFFGLVFLVKYFFENVRAVPGQDSLAQNIEGYLSESMPAMTIITFVVTVLFYIFIVKLRKISIIEICRFAKIKFDQLFTILILTFAVNILINNILTFLHQSGSMDETFEKYESIIKSILGSSNTLLLLLTVGILAPFLEEVVFRGLIFHELKKTIPLWAAVLLQAFLFGFIHLNIIQGSYAFALGILLGLSYVWTGSFWAPVIIHAVMNSTSVILSRNENMAGFFVFNTPIFILSIIFTAGGIIYLYRKRRFSVTG